MCSVRRLYRVHSADLRPVVEHRAGTNPASGTIPLKRTTGRKRSLNGQEDQIVISYRPAVSRNRTPIRTSAQVAKTRTPQKDRIGSLYPKFLSGVKTRTHQRLELKGSCTQHRLSMPWCAIPSLFITTKSADLTSKTWGAYLSVPP